MEGYLFSEYSVKFVLKDICFSVSIIFAAHNFPSQVSFTVVFFYNQNLAYVGRQRTTIVTFIGLTITFA